MRKIFNQICLLENGKLIVPWKFILSYRYCKWVNTQRTSVSAYGINDKNIKIALFEEMDLAIQPEHNSNNMWNTASIIIANDKNLINIWIEIEGYQYIELSRFDIIIKEKALPGFSGTGGSGIITPGTVYNYDLDRDVFNNSIADIYSTADDSVISSVNMNIYNTASRAINSSVIKGIYNNASIDIYINIATLISSNVTDTVYNIADNNITSGVTVSVKKPTSNIFLQDIDNLRNNLSSNLTLTKSLDFNDDASYDQTDIVSETSIGWEAKKLEWTVGEYGWLPIGLLSNNYSSLYESSPFEGVFDGAGFSIKNIFIGNENSEMEGQFISENSGEIKNLHLDISYNTSYSYGMCNINNGIINNCYITGNAYDSAGSEIPTAAGFVYENTVSGIITNCYSAVNLLYAGDDRQGLVYTNSGTVTNSYYDSDLAGILDTGKGEPKTTAEMIQQATFTGWDFDTVWNIEDGVSYPYFTEVTTPPIITK